MVTALAFNGADLEEFDWSMRARVYKISNTHTQKRIAGRQANRYRPLVVLQVACATPLERNQLRAECSRRGRRFSYSPGVYVAVRWSSVPRGRKMRYNIFFHETSTDRVRLRNETRQESVDPKGKLKENSAIVHDTSST